MNHPIISVIITIHNAEKYLKECMESVCNQTFRDIEILCMDGGSTDASPQMLLEYQKQDSRIRIINDPNTSYGHKVNVGIEQAQGEYIAVLESDDMYQPYMLEQLYEIAREHHPDFINGEYDYFFDMEGQRFIVPHKLYQKQPYNCLIENMAHPEEMEIMDRYWTGIYKKEFLQRKGIRLNESPGASFQDMSFRFLTSVLADTVYHLDVPVYLYRMDNPGSSMKDPTKTVVIANEHDYLQGELRRMQITDKVIWKLAYYWKYMDFYGNMHRLVGAGRQALFERCQTELEKDLPNIPDYNEEDYPYTSREDILIHPERYQAVIEASFQEYHETNKRNENLFRNVSRADEIVIFGCGQRGRNVYRRLHSVQGRVICFADNGEGLWYTEVNGRTVLPPKEAVEKAPDALYIVANKLHGEDMVRQLEEMGVRKVVRI